MQELFLLQKVYGRASLVDFGAYLKSVCGDLSVSFAGLRNTTTGWVRTQVSGGDEQVAMRLLEREVGLAPVSVRSVERFSIYRGRIISSGTSRLEIFVDIGVFSPRPVFAKVPLRKLQAQLADGRKLALRSLVDRFILLDNFPLAVRITEVSEDQFEAELTEQQIEMFERWTRANLDRLVVLGALASEVVRAIRRGRIQGSILRIESLGFLEHVVVCKLGTDGIGLVPRVGRLLHGAVLSVFSPRVTFEASD